MRYILIAAITILIGGGWYYNHFKVNNESVSVPTATTLHSYTSQALNISFQYPSDWIVTEGNQYPGSAQGNDEIKITKGSELIYASTKRDCLENYTYCKPTGDTQAYPYGWPYFSTTSSSQETKNVIDAIIKTITKL